MQWVVDTIVGLDNHLSFSWREEFTRSSWQAVLPFARYILAAVGSAVYILLLVQYLELIYVRYVAVDGIAPVPVVCSRLRDVEGSTSCNGFLWEIVICVKPHGIIFCEVLSVRVLLLYSCCTAIYCCNCSACDYISQGPLCWSLLPRGTNANLFGVIAQ